MITGMKVELFLALVLLLRVVIYNNFYHYRYFLKIKSHVTKFNVELQVHYSRFSTVATFGFWNGCLMTNVESLLAYLVHDQINKLCFTEHF